MSHNGSTLNDKFQVVPGSLSEAKVLYYVAGGDLQLCFFLKDEGILRNKTYTISLGTPKYIYYHI